MSFTPAQQAIYRPLVEDAWLAHCARTGLAPNARGHRETWYRQQLNEALGVYTTKQCDPTWDLDALLVHFGQLAGNDAIVKHAAASAERRALYTINRQLAELTRIEHRPVDWRYVRAVYAQMNRHHLLPDRMSDCPAGLLRKVIQALATHIRRQHRKAGEIEHAA